MSTETSLGYLCRISSEGTPIECWTLESKPLVVGRGETVDAFVDDDSLSRSHFMIDRNGPDFILVDLSSSNGTIVNGEKVAAHHLNPLDLIEAGESRFCFFTERPELSQVPVELFAHLASQGPSAAHPPTAG